MAMTLSKRLLALMAGGTLLAGCAQLSSLLTPKNDPGSTDCFFFREAPAPMFYVGFVSPASAGATVSLEPWVYLTTSYLKPDEILPQTFRADVNAAAREIVVSGRVRRQEANPQANCPRPMLAMIPQAATLSLPVVLTETGTYTVRIAAESFTTERPPEVGMPAEATRSYPVPAATRSLVID